jgi:Glycosyl hydrolase family 71
MTNIIRYKGHPYEDSCNPDYYPATGNITAPFGGLTQVKPMVNDLMANATLDEAVEFEMRAALRSGIDGFQFYYILGANKWDDIIKAYFRVAAAKHINFKFTFCISHPKGSTEALKVAEFARRINGIMDEVGHNNPHWLRTPDGRLIVYQWLGEPLADIPADKQGLPDQFYIARAYKRLADAVHERFACVYTINTQISKSELDNVLDYFPAVWIWTLPYSAGYLGNMVAGECKIRHRTFTGSVFADFYTSKLLKKGTWDMYHSASDAVDAGIGNVERKYITTGLSYNFRKLFEFGIQQNVPIINVITWNDYPEGHHLAPEINHNEGFSILLNYYKSKWKKLPSPYTGRDVAITFFKKYKHNVHPKPYDIPVKSFQQETIPASSEDSIEVVTLLKAKGLLTVNGQTVQVSAGMSSTKFKMQNGPVKVMVSRGGKTTVKFSTPEGITDRPYRTDRITYTYSSEFNRFYKNLYNGFTPGYSHEYNPGFVKSN